MTYGRIHSIQSLGAVDGPGLRSVVFFQGCPLRCIYCHNPDTWDYNDGTEISSEEVISKIKKFYPYIKKGGVTLSGGECLTQPEFAAALLKGFKEIGLHTAIDTSGVCDINKVQDILKYTDHVICDIKFPDEKEHKKYTGISFDKVKKFLDVVKVQNIPLWIRHVVIPGITDSEKSVKAVIKLTKGYDNLEKIELLPFRKLCQAKYDNLDIEFKLKDTDECSKDKINELSRLIDEKFR